MYDQFDKRLTDRIKYVFDTYEDDSAGMGWNELRKTFPGTKNRRPLVYWLSAAASVLLVSAAAWLFNMQEKTPQQQHTAQTSVSKPSETEPEAPGAIANDTEPVADRNVTRISKPARTTVNKVPVITIEPALMTSNAGNDPNRNIAARAISSDDLPVPALQLQAQADVQPVYPPKEIATTDTAYTRSNKEVYAQHTDTPQPPAGTEKLSQEDALTTGEKLARLNDLQPSSKPKEQPNKKLSFGIFAGSYVNYSEGSKSSMNTGVGLSSEIGITKKLKIATGVALAQNTLKYDRSMPEQAVQNYMATASVRTDNEKTMLTAKTSNIIYPINGYNASLLGLDFPVNIKYMFIEDKKDLYVIAGVSSNFFIDEAYSYTYEFDNSADPTRNDESAVKTSSFDFARMLNFSVGFGYPVGRQSKLSLEPFIKYPLGGLGSQDIRFGSAGLNLKLNFSTK